MLVLRFMPRIVFPPSSMQVSMSLPESAVRIRPALLRWYGKNRRDLPWRVHPEPYRTWVSEIMLQQTRVAAVLEHYARFLERFPNVQALARARSATVLAAWSGLGYYRRARMMHQAAQEIVRGRDGRFPTISGEWRSLPGVGRYTAAAICSICFGERCAVVDGNVRRVLHRLQGEDLSGSVPKQTSTEASWQMASALLSPARPGDFNQAMMELGAMVCTPRSPDCPACPVRRWCRSAQAGELPRKAKNAGPRQKSKLAYGLRTRRKRIFLLRRSDRETVMPGMWELPPVTLAADVPDSQFTLRHAIMNTDYLVQVARTDDSARLPASIRGEKAQWFSPRQAARLPLTGLARKILKHAAII
jgi:A/G-specific adenine glycosylase